MEVEHEAFKAIKALNGYFLDGSRIAVEVSDHILGFFHYCTCFKKSFSGAMHYIKTCNEYLLSLFVWSYRDYYLFGCFEFYCKLILSYYSTTR